MLKNFFLSSFFICFSIFSLEESWRDFSFQADVKIKQFSAKPLFVFRKANRYQGYDIFVSENRITFSSNFFYQQKLINFSKGKEFSLKILADGVVLKVYIDKKLVFSVRDGFSRQGKIVFQKDNYTQFTNVEKIALDNQMSTVALDVEQALNSFEIKDNLSIKAIADEHLVKNPVAVKFDPKGRLWVVEMSGYMRQEKDYFKDKVPSGNIVYLTDEDKDGVYDKRHIFLDNLTMPRAVAYVGEGILYGDDQKLYFVKEKQGKASEIQVVDNRYSGAKNPEHDSNALVRAVDNWIYSANSSKRYKKIGDRWIIAPTGKRGQWGLSQDDWGRFFYTGNSTPFIADRLLPGLLFSKDGKGKFSKDYYSKLSWQRAVYPIVDNYVNRGYLPRFLDNQGRLTKATAISAGEVYGAKNLPEKYHNAYFVTEPAGNLIQALKFEEQGRSFKVKSLFQKDDFLQSYDRIFRPVDIRTSPNGSLVIVDFYRGLIQHNNYLTNYLKQLTLDNDLGEVVDRGRIYQVYHKKRPLDKVEDLTEKETLQLIPLLSSHNRWLRQQAQNVIVDRQEKNHHIKQALVEKFSSSKGELARIHSFWTLEGLGLVNQELILNFLKLAKNQSWVKNHLFKKLASYKQLSSDQLFEIVVNNLKPNKNLTHIYALRTLSKFTSLEARNLFVSYANKLKNKKDLLPFLFIDIDKKKLQTNYALNWESFFPKPKVDKLNNISARRKHFLKSGRSLFHSQCHICHGAYGQGIAGTAPRLRNTRWVKGSKERLIAIVLKGMAGPITIGDEKYSGGVMPNFENIYNDKQLAQLISFVRHNIGKLKNPFVSEQDVAKVRRQLKGQKKSFTEETINKLFVD